MVTEKVVHKITSKVAIIKIVFFLLFIVIIASYKLWLPLPGRFLLLRDNIQKADCIVPLLGDPYFRFRKAVELYKDGYAKNIIVSYLPEKEYEYESFFNLIYGIKIPPPKEYIFLIFNYFGKDRQGVYLSNFPSTSTYEEAVAAKEIVTKKGFHSLILVTSGYHARRSMIIFKSVFRSTGVRIYNCTAKDEFYNPNHWWAKESDVREVILEYSALIHNYIYHFILKKGRTAFDSS
jgi:uncharacterized SAM-binding protein YcdF (DUF218 family)